MLLIAPVFLNVPSSESSYILNLLFFLFGHFGFYQDHGVLTI